MSFVSALGSEWPSQTPPITWVTQRAGMMRLQAVLLAVALLISRAAGQKPDPAKRPIFIYPPDGSSNIYNKLDTVMVSYQCFYETAELWTFCQPGVGKAIYRKAVPGFTATVPVLLNFTSDTPCWFNVRTGPDGIDGKNSATFNLIGDARRPGPMVWEQDAGEPKATTSSTPSSASSSSRSSSSSTSSSSSPSSSSSSTTGVSPGATPAGDGEGDGNEGSGSGSGTGNSDTPNPKPNPDSASNSGASSSGSEQTGGSTGLSAGAAAGIGVGAALGVIALAGVLFMLWQRRRRNQQQRAAAEMNGGGNGDALSRHGGGMPNYDGVFQYGSGGGGGGYAYGDGSSAGGWSPEGVAVVQKWEGRNELSAVKPPVEIQDAAGFVGPPVWRKEQHHEMSA